MSRSLGPALPPDLLARFAQTDLSSLQGRGLPLVTLGADGTLHPMLSTYLEWLAVDPRTLRLAIDGGSRSARNLRERSVGTLLLIEPGQTIYIKARAAGAPIRMGRLARFTLAIDDVLEDTPEEVEGDARIVSGLIYEPAPGLDEPWVREVLAALRA
ncbi:MAG TPA: hypothetical protein VEH80_13065 [Candidatus Bathyarchaeia archaeon]|nr:hypothetical protein [Candidatus Bathyarchaeia archaeon]